MAAQIWYDNDGDLSVFDGGTTTPLRRAVTLWSW